MTTDNVESALAQLQDGVRRGKTAIAELQDASTAMRREIEAVSRGPVNENPGLEALYRTMELLEIDLRNTAEILVGAGEVVRLVGEMRNLLDRGARVDQS